MRIENARQEIQYILSFFSESFSRPSFKFFSCFIISFIQLGKEVHTSSMVRSLAHSIMRRPSLSSFLLKILQCLKDKSISLDLSTRRLAFQVRKNILFENITVTLETMQIRFKQNILNTYLEQLWA
jgi:hypothetical protein